MVWLREAAPKGTPAADLNKTRLRKTTFSTKWPPQTAPIARRPRLHPEGAKRSEGDGGQVVLVSGFAILLHKNYHFSFGATFPNIPERFRNFT